MRRVVDIVPDQQVQLDKDWVVSTATAAVLVATENREDVPELHTYHKDCGIAGEVGPH